MAFALDGSGRVVIDLDHAVDERGHLAPDARQWVAQLSSYAELSPSGRGVHVFVAREGLSGNRRVPGLEVLSTGIVTVTGHTLVKLPIRDGDTVFEELLRRLPPATTNVLSHQAASIIVPGRAEVEGVLARAMPNDRFRRLWHGDWSEHESPSEADAAFCMHLARNGGDAGTIIELLRHSGLRRSKLARDYYVARQAYFAVNTAVVRLPQWQGFTLPAESDAEREAVNRVRAHPVLARDASLLERVASEIATRQGRGEQPDNRFFRVSPQGLSGDFTPLPGLPAPVKIMTRRGVLEALYRLAAAGVLDVRKGEDWISSVGGSKRRWGKVTLVRVDGVGFSRILHGFADRLDGQRAEPQAPPVYVLGTRCPVGDDDGTTGPSA